MSTAYPNPHEFRHLHELLDKQRLVEGLVTHAGGPRQRVVENLVHRQHRAQLAAALHQLHSADLARFMDTLRPEQRRWVLEEVGPACASEVLVELHTEVRAQLIEQLPESTLLDLLDKLDADDLAYLSDELPPSLLERALTARPLAERHWVNTTARFAEGSVGTLMSQPRLEARCEEPLEAVLARLRTLASLPPEMDKLFVLDRRGQYCGELPLSALLLNPPSARVSDCMRRDALVLTPESAALEAVQLFERYDLISAPVVNARGKLLGSLDVDVVMDYAREHSAEEALGSAGLHGEEDLFAPLMRSARNRWSWLAMSLGTAMLASSVIGLFEQTISHIIALAALMPIVAALGGNTGNQTTALVVRGLALGRITPANLRPLLAKELRLSLFGGLTWGTLVGLFALVVYQQLALSLVIALAMLLTLLLAALAGVGIPLTLAHFGRDPALGSSVLVTAITDSIGFFVFLGLAQLLLL